MVSDATRRYLDQISSLSKTQSEPDTPVVHVDYVASKIASLYEKLRQVIDYQEDHLLRRNTVERILKRRLLLSLDSEEVAEPLVFELIRGGYFANDKIPETKIGEVKQVLAKYIFLMDSLPNVSSGEKRDLSDWLKSLGSSEIEEKLAPQEKQDALLNYMVREMSDRLVFAENIVLDDRLRKELIFVACERTLLKADPIMLNWGLLKMKFPEFANSPGVEYLTGFSQNLLQIKKQINEAITHPLIKRIMRRTYRFSPVFLLLQDVAIENANDLNKAFENQESLQHWLRFFYDKRHRELKRNNRTWGFRWILSILLSKMFLAFLMEVPYDRYTGNFSPVAASINLFVPPFLMFLIVASIRLPKEQNKNIVCSDALKTVYQEQDRQTILVEKPLEKRGLGAIFVRFIFFLISLLVFGGVIYLLLRVSFSWLSIVIFLAFFSLIAFSGMRIEAATKQLKGGDREKEDDIVSFLADVFFLPFRSVGKWLSKQLQRYNLIILMLNLFFEAPLQIFFEFVEDWRNFLKKKKEDMET